MSTVECLVGFERMRSEEDREVIKTRESRESRESFLGFEKMGRIEEIEERIESIEERLLGFNEEPKRVSKALIVTSV